ncbi:hypothetical protein CBM2592_B130048 [Cupriavidus taiwanensis]|nr:hypothetical protein CBM2588_B170048 [Cupriavidus taiwanensis]SOY66237.1 hypothetical protein CBM2592_B130048 [Cupriavidus taiwanensis]SOY94287.1 hypothetical protein CBM2591_B120048 [Cupriavidus taiwanensis]SOZ86169.1 hypothetical protein CBM2618_B170049 [Cupriavidus taiwanensis]SOZ89482.1 hypothetical protein CBM2622_B170048 [Cupriavidus taiwanensis]
MRAEALKARAVAADIPCDHHGEHGRHASRLPSLSIYSRLANVCRPFALLVFQLPESPQQRVHSPTFHIDTDTARPACLHLGTFPNRSFSRFFDGAIPGMLADAMRRRIDLAAQGNCLISKDS